MPYFLLDNDALRAIGYWTASPIGYRLETSSMARVSSLS